MGRTYQEKYNWTIILIYEDKIILYLIVVHICSLENMSEACPIGVCVTLSGKFPYAPYNYLTNGAGSEQTLRCRSHIVRLQRSKTENN